ncbi:MAG: radical SAM protein [Succiniclasticum sp.]|jgi:uncharacterized protein|nr:radical SAM protein [Succiniclasticum sp.]
MTAMTTNKPPLQETGLPPVRMLVLTLTGRCNFACRYCYAASVAAEDMDEDTAVAAVHLAGRGRKRFLLQFSGGEPLLCFPLIQKLIRVVEENHYDAQMQLQTNGSLLTPEIGRYLFDHQVGLGLSCDGHPALMDRMRAARDGSSSSRLTAAAARNLAAQGIGTGLTCVVTADSVEELPGIADMAHFYGNVHQVGFDILREQGRGAGMKAPTAEAMTRALEKTYARMEALEKATGRKVHFTQEDRVRRLAQTGQHDFPQCYAMHGEAAFVDVHGDIYACSSLVGRPEYRLGNVRTGREPEKVRAVARRIQEAMAECRHCPYFPLCGGGCFSRWLRKDGVVRRVDAECAMKQFFIKKYKEHHKEEFSK